MELGSFCFRPPVGSLATNVGVFLDVYAAGTICLGANFSWFVGEAGGATRLRYEQITSNIAKRKEELQQLIANGEQAAADNSSKVLAGLENTAISLQQQLAQESLSDLLIMGIVMILLIKVLGGFYANIAYEKRYLLWRIRPASTKKGVNRYDLGWGCFFAS